MARGRRRKTKKTLSIPYLKEIIIFIIILIFGLSIYNKFFVFNAQKILDHSILQTKSFNSKVKEVISPKYKIKAYLLEDKSNPIISMNFMFKSAGLASDDVNKRGIANVVASLLTQGTQDLTSQEFKEKLEDLAISMDFDANLDNFEGSLLTLKENQTQAFDLLKNVLSNARFDEEDLSRIKQQYAHAFKRQNEQPTTVLSLESAKYIFENHPYAQNPLGDIKSIQKLNKADLQEFVKNHFARNNSSNFSGSKIDGAIFPLP